MEQEKKAAEAKSAEKVYTQKDMLLYCGLTGLITGVIGYFIGEHRGEKKAKKKYEEAVNKWHSASGKKGKKDDADEVFEL